VNLQIKKSKKLQRLIIILGLTVSSSSYSLSLGYSTGFDFNSMQENKLEGTSFHFGTLSLDASFFSFSVFVLEWETGFNFQDRTVSNDSVEIATGTIGIFGGINILFPLKNINKKFFLKKLTVGLGTGLENCNSLGGSIDYEAANVNYDINHLIHPSFWALNSRSNHMKIISLNNNSKKIRTVFQRAAFISLVLFIPACTGMTTDEIARGSFLSSVGIKSIFVDSSTQIQVNFNQEMGNSGMTNISNYEIIGENGHALDLISLNIAPQTQNSVINVTTALQASVERYTLIVKSIAGASGKKVNNKGVSDSFTSFPRDNIAINSVIVDSSTQIQVKYNQEMASDGLASTGNYEIIDEYGDALDVLAIVIVPDEIQNSVVSLTTALQASAERYTLRVRNLSGASSEQVQQDGIIAFFTSFPRDILPPQIASTLPVAGQTEVDISSAIEIVFSEAMLAESIQAQNLELRLGLDSIPSVVSYDAATNTAILTPSADLEGLTEYTLMVNAGVTDEGGNELEQDFIFSFTTRDAQAPLVSSYSPQNDQINVSDLTFIEIEFNEAMDANSINASTITLDQNGQPVAAVVLYDSVSNSASLTPGSALGLSQTYTVTIYSTTTDSSGNSLGQDFSFSFTTSDCPSPSELPLSTDDDVRVLAKQGCTIYIGGDFSQIGASTPSGAVVDINNAKLIAGYKYANINAGVLAAASDGNGGWYIGGYFTEIDGQSRNYLARLNSDGSLHDWNPGVDKVVYSLYFDGTLLYAGGEFDMAAGQARSHLAAFDSIGSLTSFNPNINGNDINVITIYNDVIYAGGDFTQVNSQTRNNAFAVSADGTLLSWDADAGNDVFSMTVANDIVYLGGTFTTLQGQNRRRLGAVAIDGTLQAWNPEVTGNFSRRVYDLVVDDSVVYIAGNIDGIKYGGTTTTRNNLAAISAPVDVNDPGTLLSWNPNANDYTRSIFVDNGILYFGGDFTQVDGTARGQAAAVDTTGILQNWAPETDDGVYAASI